MIHNVKPKTKSPVAVAAAGRAGIEPGSNKSLSPNGSSEIHGTPPVNPAQQGIANDTCDRFFERMAIVELLDFLRDPLTQAAARRYSRALLESPYRGEERMALACFAHAQITETFVATVAGRGFIGKLRTVLLKDLRLFGSKFLQEDHIWVVCNKAWARIEPFYQGEKVVLVGTAVKYTRKNGSCDFTLGLDYVTKLWPANTTTVSNEQASVNPSTPAITELTTIHQPAESAPPTLTRRHLMRGEVNVPPYSKTRQRS